MNAATLQKLGIARNNESYVLNIFRFLKLIDEDGKRTPLATTVFSQHDDDAFAAQFKDVVKNAYTELFELHGENVWNLDKNALTTFFRHTDHTSAIVGERQASTFQVLAALAGYGEPPGSRTTPPARSSTATKSSPKSSKKNAAATVGVPTEGAEPEPLPGGSQKTPRRHFGLTVRIEINLPSVADQGTYDKIFRSIKENLLDGQ